MVSFFFNDLTHGMAQKTSTGVVTKAAALKHFKKVDPILFGKTKTLHASLPTMLSGKRTNAALLNALISIVISQQLGVAAADTIFMRAKRASGGTFTPASILATSATTYATAGLSGAKIKTIQSIARAITDGTLNLTRLRKLPESEITERLLAVWGLGPWSVDMFMLFALGKGDVFSPGDLGLIRAMETLYDIPKKASREIFVTKARTWSPHRTYACLLLWRSRDAMPKELSKGRHR